MNAQSYKMAGQKVSVFYGQKRALFDVDLNIRENAVTALIGPSGLRQVPLFCARSTA